MPGSKEWQELQQKEALEQRRARSEQRAAWWRSVRSYLPGMRREQHEQQASQFISGEVGTCDILSLATSDTHQRHEQHASNSCRQPLLGHRFVEEEEEDGCQGYSIMKAVAASDSTDYNIVQA